jgi:hypothetical protein
VRDARTTKGGRHTLFHCAGATLVGQSDTRQSDSPTVRQSDSPTVRQSDSPTVRRSDRGQIRQRPTHDSVRQRAVPTHDASARAWSKIPKQSDSTSHEQSDTRYSLTVRQSTVRQWSDSGPTVVRLVSTVLRHVVRLVPTVARLPTGETQRPLSSRQPQRPRTRACARPPSP